MFEWFFTDKGDFSGVRWFPESLFEKLFSRFLVLLQICKDINE